LRAIGVDEIDVGITFSFFQNILSNREGNLFPVGRELRTLDALQFVQIGNRECTLLCGSIKHKDKGQQCRQERSHRIFLK